MTITENPLPTTPVDDHHHDNPNLDRGLTFDMSTAVTRRRALQVFGLGAGAVALAGCGIGARSSEATTSTTAAAGSTTTTAGTLTEIPEETAGPYPGDGSNGPNALEESGIVRSDIRSSINTGSATAEGVPLTIGLDLVNLDADNAAFAGAAVYLWHCNREGEYSMYSDGLEDENYLRGVQVADASGSVRFMSIFPAAYSGRWPHIHFEVYKSADDAIRGADPIATSQVALPQDACDAVYATDGYSASVRNMEQTSLDDDNVFGDDSGATQSATVTGSVDGGYTAILRVGIAESTEAGNGGAAPSGGGGMGAGGGMGGPPARK